MNNENLKPVIMDGVKGNNSYYRENVYAQNLLLKALADGITDPTELRKIAGLKTVTEVYRTLDKMQIRKEYHAALTVAGLDLPFIVGQLKALCGGGTADKVKLGALQTVLKSVGLDKYEKDDNEGKNWEQIILDAIDKKEKGEMVVADVVEDDYKVIEPVLPDEVKKRQSEEKKEASELYD
jgi:hypothetical protein